MHESKPNWEKPTLTWVDISDCNVNPGNQASRCTQPGGVYSANTPCCRIKPGCTKIQFAVQS